MNDLFKGTPTTSTPGTPIPVSYTNPDRAGQTVDIEIDDDAGNVTTVSVTLDDQGKGSFTHTPPSGYVGSLGLNGPDSREHQIIISSPTARSAKPKKKTPRTPAKKPAKRPAAKARKR